MRLYPNDDLGGQLSRRGLLGGSAAAAAALGLAPSASSLPRPSGGGAGRDLLLYIFLRGGADGLTLVPPHGDGDMYSLRPNLAIQPPGSVDGAVDLDGFFGLAPAAAALQPLFAAGHLAIVHAAGSTDPNRSHFEAMKFIETATPQMPSVLATDGWLGRHLASVAPLGSGDLRGLAVSSTLPLTLAGGPNVLPTWDPASLDFFGHWDSKDRREAILQNLYGQVPAPVGSAALSSLASIDILQALDLPNYQPANGASYPESFFGNRMAQVAAMVKGDVGLEAIELDYGGWDDHDNLGPVSGAMAARMQDFSLALAAFHQDLGQDLGKVTVVVQSEFGRRADENGSAGTDHGRGGVMLLLGGAVNGGQVYGSWPGLGPAQLDDFALAVTTDYRDVLGEVLAERLGNTDLAGTFLGYQPTFMGLIG